MGLRMLVILKDLEIAWDDGPKKWSGFTCGVHSPVTMTIELLSRYTCDAV